MGGISIIILSLYILISFIYPDYKASYRLPNAYIPMDLKINRPGYLNILV